MWFGEGLKKRHERIKDCQEDINHMKGDIDQNLALLGFFV